jgi:uncharacterized protein involved in type VI secretion and phage assembly
MAPYDLAGHFSDQIHRAESEANKIYEPAIGIVTDNKDPSKLGRVKVKIPILSDQDTTWWCPIVMFGGGKNRGWFFIPEVNDEVLVLFEHGDGQRPIIVGALWNGKDKPPDKNPGSVPRRIIKSRAGSKVTFDDEKGSISLEDGGGKGKITFDAGSNKITIEAMTGDVCFQSPAGDMVIVAKSAEFKATGNLEMHAGSTMSWGTDASGSVKGGTVTMSGANANANCGQAQAPAAPTASPKDVDDPYKS